MKTLHRAIALALFLLLAPLASAATEGITGGLTEAKAPATGGASAPAVEVRPDSPVIQLPDKATASVLEDRGHTLDLAAVRALAGRFVPAAQMGPPDANSRYWVAQRIRSQLPTDREIRLMPGGGRGWRNVELTVVADDGRVIAHAGPSGTLQGAHNRTADLNPFQPIVDSPRATLPLFTLRSGESVTVYIRGEADARFPPKGYAASVVDQLRYQELRRLGLYTEGALAGAMLALAIFGWYSALRNKDHTSIAYAVWIVFALFSSCTQIVHDGQRLYELFFDVENVRVNHLYVSETLTFFLSFGQSMTYVYFARTFLDVRQRFPAFYTVTNLYLVFYACYLSVLLLVDMRNINATFFWLPIGLATFVMLIGIYVCAFIRLREGMEIARFFMIAMVPYLIFRTVFLLNVAGLPSPFQLLPDTGLAYFIKDPSTAQALGVTLEALIMALAVISRTRWLQDQLAARLQEQKHLVENQNRMLELTVAERTRELAEQHDLVVSSVNYASKLQRSQLPRSHRLQGRFDSLGVVWEPRDTIGGDLWWISPVRQDGHFTLAVADCTGHGVPGAMLSLLVSNSLERIHSGQKDVDPADVLLKLDQLMRTGLNQDSADAESDDGCDAAVARVDLRARELHFAGAKIGLFHLHADGRVTRHPAARASLGYQQPLDEEEMPRTTRIAFADGDAFVLVTDGYTDQPGGEGERPVSYGYRRLEALLSSLRTAPASEIADAMEGELRQWQRGQRRRDDVTAVVFRLRAPSRFPAQEAVPELEMAPT